MDIEPSGSMGGRLSGRRIQGSRQGSKPHDSIRAHLLRRWSKIATIGAELYGSTRAHLSGRQDHSSHHGHGAK
jgi:hypothetical protein